ncbi:predicted protein [Plenodomus lingam JN3]|uniref:Predicted protein n=1 Tax=Leptosphaeria maculans (strain JN3 / isolate v23.1.3 / race Av1-4-5-6-7-8) TaxID=985895 RepID=E5A8V4_LEPMJ|nr:predicted protein [Plenodomus lingam JN3]CBY00049.1 predicted protein [Plenodomus lingam JN3]
MMNLLLIAAYFSTALAASPMWTSGDQAPFPKSDKTYKCQGNHYSYCTSWEYDQKHTFVWRGQCYNPTGENGKEHGFSRNDPLPTCTGGLIRCCSP